MAINIKSTKAVSSDTGVNVLVIGRSGVGKTPLIGTAPRPIVLAVEKGLLSLSGTDVPYQETPNMQDFIEMLEYLENDGKKEYDTACIDSISELAEIHLAELLKTYKDPRQAYGEVYTSIMAIVKRIISLPMDTYTIGKETTIVSEDTGLTSNKILMPGKRLHSALPYEFDISLALRIRDAEGDKEAYSYLQTMPCEKYDTRDRSGTLNKIERPNLTTIFEKAKAKGEAATKTEIKM